MSAPNDGGSAFPHPGYHGIDGKFVDVPHQGMTLRDWFAGLALQGFCANPQSLAEDGGFSHDNFRAAYDFADAMIEERQRRENQ